MKNYNLNERLISFAVSVIQTSKNIESSKAGNHLSGQIIRSGTSPSLNYSEALAAESRNDFNHKMAIVLKELRETHTCLRIIQQALLFKGKMEQIDQLLLENNELVAIFVKSIKTSKYKNVE